jgi:hypothetical protein
MSNREETSSRAGYNVVQQNRSEQFLSDIRPRPDEKRQARSGRIVKYHQRIGDGGMERFEVEIRFDDKLSNIQQGSYRRAFILSHTPEELAMLYGDPDTIIGKRVSVESNSGKEDQGIATIVNDSGEGNLEKANLLKPFGTLLAPAGSAMV